MGSLPKRLGYSVALPHARRFILLTHKHNSERYIGRMRTWLVLVFFPLVAGCYVGPVFNVKKGKRTCPDDFLQWTGGLTYHILQGRGDGTFDYVPEQSHIDLVDGFYDLEEGDFWWQTFYTSGNRLDQDLATGAGWA